VRDVLRDVMRIRNLGLLFLIGRVIRITSRVQRIHRLVGAINAGVIKGMYPFFLHVECSHYSNEDFYRRKFDLLEDQIMVWIEEFHVQKFEVWLQSQDACQGTSNSKATIDANKARMYVLGWRDEWERTRQTPSIKIRPV
jgi:hypothetical protein